MPEFKEIRLPPDDRMAHSHNRLFALLNILDQLQRRRIALLHIVANIFVRLLLAIDHPLILAVQP